MIIALSLLLALLPSVLFVILMRWWDRREPEPPRLLLRLFLAGAFAALAMFLGIAVAQVVLVSAGILPPFDTLAAADGLPALLLGALVIAGVHEGVKLLLAKHLVHRERAFTQIVDGIVYLTTIAWGAAFMENVLRVVVAARAGALLPADMPRLLFSFVFTTLLVGVSSGIMGLGLGIAHARRHRSAAAAAGLGSAVLLHAAYRFLLFLDEPRLAGTVVLLGALFLFSRFAVARFTQTTPGPQRNP